MDVPAVLWVAFAAIILLHAAACDLRSREVPDWHWAALGTVGPVLCLLSVHGAPGFPSASCIMLGSVMLTVCMLSESLHGPWAVLTIIAATAVMAIPLATGASGWSAYSGLSSAVMYLLFYAMYMTGLLHGGADAKCLMSLALAFPVYPVSDPLPLVWTMGFPESLVMNPSMSIMVLALLLSLSSSLYVLGVNLRGGYRGRRMLTAFPMDVGRARTSFVWPVERFVDGRIEPCRDYDSREEVLDGLIAAGVERILVTPMIPFVVPVAASFAITIILGSPLAAVLSV